MKKRIFYTPIIIAIAIFCSDMNYAQTRHLFKFRNEKSLYGYIDNKGNYIIPPTFDGALDFSENLAGVLIGQRWGVIDTTGAIVIKPVFILPKELPDYPLTFHNGRAIAPAQKKNSSETGWGFIDIKGKWVVAPIYDYVRSFSESIAIVGTGRDRWLRTTYIDTIGNMLYDFSFSSVFPFSNGYGLVTYDRRNGYIGNDGKFVTDIYPDVKNQTVYAFMDRQGKFLMKQYFIEAKPFSEGKAAVSMGWQRWGYIDTTGAWLTSTNYHRAFSFCEGIAKVVEDYITCFIRIEIKDSGNSKVEVERTGIFRGLLVPESDCVKEGVLLHSSGDGYGYMSPWGGGIWQILPQYMQVRDFSEGFAAVQDKSNQKWGYINSQGGWIIGSIFDESKDFYRGLAEVRTGTGMLSWGYINPKGELVPKEFAEHYQKRMERLNR